MGVQPPEPFSGHIKGAPILITSSNPSFDNKELYPDWTWPINVVHDFFLNRFADRGPIHSWVYENRCLLKSGSRGKKVTTWREIQKNITELLGREAIPGVDYAFADIVHCKSQKNIGVKAACSNCVKSYFNDLISVAKPCLIIAVGATSRDFFKTTFNTISNYKGIAVLCSPAPGSSVKRNFNKVFTAKELLDLRDLVNKCRPKLTQKYVPISVEKVKEFIDLKLSESGF
jgi:hypothetical protein